MAKDNKKQQHAKESLMIVRPAVRRWGLDYLHVSLIILVVILIAFAFALSAFKPGPIYASCPGGIVNGTCEGPSHTSAQVLAAGESVLAAYAPVNTSLSLLAYYSSPNHGNASYVANTGEWLVQIPYLNPFSGNKNELTMLLYDSNLSLVRPFLQTAAPAQSTKNRVVALGVIQLAGKSLCTSKTPIPVYDMVDPYAPGAMAGLFTGVNASAAYGSSINMSYKIIFTGYAVDKYSSYGENETQETGAYLWCASNQPRFKAFLENYSLVFNGEPLNSVTLYQTAQGSGLNMSQLGSCLNNASGALIAQSKLAQFYNITTTPTFLVDCRYSTIPQTLSDAVPYVLNQTK
ncbi:MAG: hypothetical protein LVQ95_01000 [Candidatus Micrarchaeales archaeon]|nr:hypothetical protein [Candidatus Micrarchaeales archaeon]